MGRSSSRSNPSRTTGKEALDPHPYGTEFRATSAAKQKTIVKAKQAHWRAGVHEAATSLEGIWKLAKWARTKSHLPREPAKMPDLRRNRTIASTASEKAAALVGRFFLKVDADLTDIIDHKFTGNVPTELHVNQTTDE